MHRLGLKNAARLTAGRLVNQVLYVVGHRRQLTRVGQRKGLTAYKTQ